MKRLFIKILSSTQKISNLLKNKAELFSFSNEETEAQLCKMIYIDLAEEG